MRRKIVTEAPGETVTRLGPYEPAAERPPLVVDSWDLRLGDCLDPLTGLASLPDGCVDHVITDPPYEAEAHAKARRQSRGPGHIAETYVIPFEQITEAQRSGLASEASRLGRRWVLVFCQAEGLSLWRAAYEAVGVRYRRAIVWVKPDSAPQFTGDRPAQAFEMIALGWVGGGRSVWNGGGRRGVYEALVNNFGRSGGSTGRAHPTQKPIDLMEALIRDFTNPGDLVLDPFAGSGTTGVACIRNGRRFLGWERDAKYHEIATRRLAAAREQMGLFGGAA